MLLCRRVCPSGAASPVASLECLRPDSGTPGPGSRSRFGQGLQQVRLPLADLRAFVLARKESGLPTKENRFSRSAGAGVRCGQAKGWLLALFPGTERGAFGSTWRSSGPEGTVRLSAGTHPVSLTPGPALTLVSPPRAMFCGEPVGWVPPCHRTSCA